MLAARSSTDGGQVLGDLLRAAYFGDNAEEAVVVAEVGSGGGTNNLTRLVSVGARRYVRYPPSLSSPLRFLLRKSSRAHRPDAPYA